MYQGLCPECESAFEKLMNKVKHNRKQGEAGPFCGKSCTRKYQARVVERKTRQV